MLDGKKSFKKVLIKLQNTQTNASKNVPISGLVHVLSSAKTVL